MKLEEEGLVVDLRAMDRMNEVLGKIALRLDSIEEVQRQQGLKLDALFMAPLLSTDIVGNDALFATGGRRAPSYDRVGAVNDIDGDGNDNYDDRRTRCCTYLCRLIDDWWLLCCGS